MLIQFIFQPKKILLILSFLFIIPAICLFFNPLIPSTDSIYGFLAYKGSLYAHAFNIIADVSPDNINNTDKSFVSWWSPGQWLLPASLNYLFGLRLGVASIFITLIFCTAGLWGYYKLF